MDDEMNQEGLNERQEDDEAVEIIWKGRQLEETYSKIHNKVKCSN